MLSSPKLPEVPSSRGSSMLALVDDVPDDIEVWLRMLDSPWKTEEEKKVRMR